MLVLTTDQALNCLGRSVRGNALLPRLMTNGRMAVPEGAATDPAHAAVSAVLAEGSVEAVTSGEFESYGEFVVDIDGKPMRMARPDNSYSIGAPADGVMRFELRANDFGHIDDATINGNKRVEFVATGSESHIYSGEAMWQSFSIVLGSQHDGLYASGGQGILFQMHSLDSAVPVGRTPVVVVDAAEGYLTFITRSSDEISPGSYSGVNKVRYQQPLPAAGTPVHIVLYSLLGEAGHFSAWVDGTQVYDGDVPIGYYATDIPAGLALGEPHWGLYMKNVPTTDVVYMANLEWGSSDLSARVSSPIAVPDLSPWA